MFTQSDASCGWHRLNPHIEFTVKLQHISIHSNKYQHMSAIIKLSNLKCEVDIMTNSTTMLQKMP